MNGDTEDEDAPEAHRMTFNLSARSGSDMRQAMILIEEDRTGTVNRALKVFAYLLREQAAGRELVIRDPDTGKESAVVFL